MATLLLRIMTRKSTIGFGRFKNTTVQNLLTQNNYEALLSIYYNLELVTFDNDVLNELSLVGSTAIDKPGKNKDKGEKYIKSMAEQLRQIHGFYKQTQHSENPMNNYSQRAKMIRRAKEVSKMLNKNRVQGKK